jgi:hypothetical protein
VRRYTVAQTTTTIEATAVPWYSQCVRSVPASAAWKLTRRNTA